MIFSDLRLQEPIFLSTPVPWQVTQADRTIETSRFKPLQVIAATPSVEAAGTNRAAAIEAERFDCLQTFSYLGAVAVLGGSSGTHRLRLVKHLESQVTWSCLTIMQFPSRYKVYALYIPEGQRCQQMPLATCIAVGSGDTMEAAMLCCTISL
jgi:hypothetical protein